MTSSASEATMPIFRHRPFALFWSGRVASTMAFQLQGVAVGWQIYALTHSALALGLVGLAQFLPMLALTLIVGHAADRYDRRRIPLCCQFVAGLTTAFLAAGSLGGWLTPGIIFAAVTVIGAERAFEMPTMQALLPGLVPPPLFPRAAAYSASAIQTATIIGPAVGGLLYAAGPEAPYALAAVLSFTACGLTTLIRQEEPVPRRVPATFKSLFSGPQLAGPAKHAGRDARAGQRRQLDVHRHLEPAGRVRIRRHRGAVRRRAGGNHRRLRHHPGCPALDAAVPGLAEGGQLRERAPERGAATPRGVARSGSAAAG